LTCNTFVQHIRVKETKLFFYIKIKTGESQGLNLNIA